MRNDNRRSFFEWAMPDRVSAGWLLRVFGIFGLIIVLAAILLAPRLTRHLSVDGGPDQVAAGFPGFDGGIPRDQLAAGVPALDDPEPLEVGPAPPPDEDEEENQEEEDREEAGSDISDDGGSDDLVDPADLIVDLGPIIRPGAWNVTIVEHGDAACGYPDEPMTYEALVVVSDLADEATVEDTEGEDEYVYEIHLPFNQIFLGSGASSPVETEASGPGWREVRTITAFDPDQGVLETDGYYETGDCRAERHSEAISFTVAVDF